jgi:hypothetical protein
MVSKYSSVRWAPVVQSSVKLTKAAGWEDISAFLRNGIMDVKVQDIPKSEPS